MEMDVKWKTENILTQAISFRASDIHIVPMEKSGVIRFRVDGNLVEIEKFPLTLINKLINHLKFISGMDVGERRRPQNSSLTVPLLDKSYAIRLSTFPSSFNETLVIRLFPHENHLSLPQLSLFPYQATKLINMIHAPYGLYVICGPTGSGKTTTLYSLLHTSFNVMKRNIITLEDPVEQRCDQFLQMEINERAGITYSSGLRSLLRHDPDIIMIGEIRDSETAKMAVRAALTGHLVLTTLHSKNSVSALKRLHELGVKKTDLLDVIGGVVSQRLVNMLCPYCGASCVPYCKKQRKRRRGAVYEILTGTPLQEAIGLIDSWNSMTSVVSINKVICKGIALGFIHESEYNRIGKGV
ncbi:competence type IV pilus ATPase ComGA [Evansella sp. AB-P1]|uniref:competence type IV pilus ATPase ComGA n=1 Tax=Evansella sp. AB-P1 TaxID=3037653 RepID=UPI00241F58B1|nr:competence type IV pilus ATPase ComGA [Evansella sp. AB-P1]MDG5788728.1 competence type IV pilus ATPase ComGA [Evansella sp. AB-P1]